MAVYRQIQISFWQDDFVLNLTPEEKYFYIYLMTNSKTTQCGIYELPKKIIEFETGYNRETVDKLLGRFIEYGKILYDESTKEIMLINWLKYNITSSDKVLTRIKKDLAEIKSNALIERINTLSIPYLYPMDTLWIPNHNNNNKNNNNDNDKKKNNIFSAKSVEWQLANELKNYMLKNNPNAKVPDDLNKWAVDFDKIIRIDNRAPELIREVMKFSQDDDFWRTNILSPSKLRKQFDQLFLKSRPKGGKPSGVSGSNHSQGQGNSKPKKYNIPVYREGV